MELSLRGWKILNKSPNKSAFDASLIFGRELAQTLKTPNKSKSLFKLLADDGFMANVLGCSTYSFLPYFQSYVLVR